MLYFPVRSLPNSANPSGFNTYKIRKNNPLYFQHLRDPLVSAHSKGTSTPADSTLTRPLSLTPLESTLTKNRGEGVGVPLVFPTKKVSLTKNSWKLASLFHSLCQEQNASPIFSVVCALFAKNTGVYPNYSQNGTTASRPCLHESCLTPIINATPLTLSARFSSLPLHTFSLSFGGRRVD